MIFIDEARIAICGGRGGNGCVAFRREKFVPRGGPSGGDGGHGGSVWLQGSQRCNTLYHLRFPGERRAERGRHGEGSNRTGKSGRDLVIDVPLGTQVYEEGRWVGELLQHGERLEVARGGRGGRGNARFATATRQAPRQAEPGAEGQERELTLELKLLADVGVLGLPNAGKSTLIGVVSAARPKVGDYPFTTLVPQLGVVASDDSFEPFVIADLPGLIAGAAQGAGLGIRFLRHVERCRVLVHLVDLSAQGSLRRDVETVEEELRAFSPELLTRPRLLAGSKLDAADPKRQRELREVAAQRGLVYRELSAVTRTNIPTFIAELRRRLDEVDEGERAAEADRVDKVVDESSRSWERGSG